MYFKELMLYSICHSPIQRLAKIINMKEKNTIIKNKDKICLMLISLLLKVLLFVLLSI